MAILISVLTQQSRDGVRRQSTECKRTMSEILSNPFLQSSVLPFVIALVIGLVTSRLLPAWTGVSVMIAFLVAAYFIAGLDFSPLTSTRKIILTAIAASLVGMGLDVLSPGRRISNTILLVISLAAVTWMLWPVLSRREGMALWWPALGALAYTGWCVLAFNHVSGKAVAVVSGAMILAAGSGIAATVAATALLGQLVSTIAAGCGALWLLLVFRNIHTGVQLSFPAVLSSALFGIAAVFYARLPWVSIGWLALVPVLALLPAPVKLRWQQAVYYIVITALPAGVAVYQAWLTAGDIPF